MFTASLQKGAGYEAEPRMSFLEGARDVAVLEAMLESGGKQGAPVLVKKFWQNDKISYFCISLFLSSSTPNCIIKDSDWDASSVQFLLWRIYVEMKREHNFCNDI